MNPTRIDRRDFVRWCGATALVAAGGAMPPAQEQDKESESGRTRTGSARPLLEDLGVWVAAMRYEDLPPATVKKAKYLLLDTLGCALGAVDGGPVRIAQRVVSARGGNPQASVIGAGWKTSCDEAAFLNAMAIRYLDFNDYAAFGFPHHPSINVAPALAVAEMRKLSGRDLLLGLTVGYEVQVKVRDASEGGRRGFDLPSVEAQYSSAAAAARLLGLDAKAIANAVAIAASYANTLSEVRSGGELTNAKGTAEALAARNGTFAAFLAQGGLQYPLSIVDGESGYGKVANGGLKAERLRSRSGNHEILKSCTKMWPSIGTSQAPIAAALSIRSRGVKADDIQRVTLHLSDFGYQQQQGFHGAINTREHADHSVWYLVARAFIDGDVRIEDFDERRFRDPKPLAFIERITVVSDPALTTAGGDVLGARMEVVLRDGSVQKADVPYPPGSYQNPATDAQIQHKFLTLAERTLGKAGGERAMQAILGIDTKKDLTELIAALTPANRGEA
ncbi:MAG TPA: MmgE/PrpD family protein [Vicinamibacterales bacterium]|nr:MmgE/PrpD family protein [Vicinamibacterales bacterium]